MKKKIAQFFMEVKKVKLSVISVSNSTVHSTKRECEVFSGHVAGVCYMPNDFNSLLMESVERTNRRINMTKSGGHHSVYDHNHISFYLDGIPKALAMVLNNEKMYTTSEKSARYTKMKLSDDEEQRYLKWMEIFRKKIAKKYKDKFPNYFTDSKIEKLAQENARYLISIFVPTSMVYSVSYRQLNYLYAFLKKESKRADNKLYIELRPHFEQLSAAIEECGFFDAELANDGKNRTLSLVTSRNREEYFGDVYCVRYQGSFAQLAQAHRHRTIDYAIRLLDEPKYFVPPIISDDAALTKDWLDDCALGGEFIQGSLVEIVERGTIENFVLKLKERKCTYAQLEIDNQSTATLNRYYNELKEKNPTLANDFLLPCIRGSRCTFPDYTCTSPCGFPDGVSGKRLI